MTSSRLTPAAFAERFQQSWRTLWCIATAVVHDRALVEDVLQEAAMVALGKLPQFDADTNFSAWMGRIVRFVALNHARRRLRAGSLHTDPHTLEAVPQSVDPQPKPVLTGTGQLLPGHEEFDDRLLGALRTLEETARACLLLRTLLDMPYRDIAQALDIAEGTAMSHVHRARKALRDRLSDSMLSQPSASLHPSGHPA